MTAHIDFVEPKFEDDDSLTLSVGGLYDHPTHESVHLRWIPRQKLNIGDEVTFRIVESDTADPPVEEEIPEPGWREKQERKYYEMLKAKYESSTDGEVPEPDGPMTSEQQALVDQLSAEDVRAIDEALLSNASHQWRKIARVVGRVMMSPLHKPGIPDLYYAERVKHLVANDQLESQGNLTSMRLSEVRLPQ